MAGSLIGGLINAGYPAASITVAEPDEQRLQALTAQYKVNVTMNNDEVLHCDVIILSVKPQRLKTVCQQLDSRKIHHSLFISIAAGVKSSDINRWLRHGKEDGPLLENQAIVRCMPNTPALLQCGASGLFANEQVSQSQKQLAEQIMSAVGIVVWLETEQQLNAVTAISGSGPAYFFLLMEAMQQAAEKLGLSSEIAQQLVLQTALGAARMATENGASPATLRQSVTSKGGTTEQAILHFQSANYQQIVMDAVQAANDRSISLADELGSD